MSNLYLLNDIQDGSALAIKDLAAAFTHKVSCMDLTVVLWVCGDGEYVIYTALCGTNLLEQLWILDGQ